ncbi:polysaccharide deacetylase family protein [Advenella alkanexedens]|uniref:polysaccharide deacetylase family protein n=1 Tax=Advenella alkanexedens TaxID=1481665 RepID=UPI0026776010|nr:polysaccharide deacetylase family protein [Advenella alkanexedens]WKU20359.1 polysaccharide deacetylase family protein [Advenella alkanexedens]
MGSKNARSVPVLMYHHITPSSGQITTSPENFDSQMAALVANGYTSLTADQFAGYLKGEAVPEKSVLITFDDGYLDNYVYAHPILQKHGMHAVMFLVTNWAGQGDPRPVYGSGDPLPVCPSHHECNAIVAAGKANDIAVRWSEVRAMEAAGTFEVHCHTHTHTRWDLNCDRAGKCAGIANDLQLSRAALLRELNKDTPHLCWPQGYFDDDYIQAAEALGFSVFYTTDAYGFNVVGGDPKYVYRIAVRNKPGAWLMHRIGIAKNPYWGPLYNRWKKFRKQRRRARELRRASKA